MNVVLLRGQVAKQASFSHSSHGKNYFQMDLATLRLSGTQDILCVLMPEELLLHYDPRVGDRVEIDGQIRSFNNKSGLGNRLVISVLARSITVFDGEDINQVSLRGSLCKAPIYRKTPLGREICDLLLAVARPYGRADFIPVICWGQCARESAQFFVGQPVSVVGRFQSRPYIKLINGQPYDKIAFEVSAVQILPEMVESDRINAEL